MLRPLCICNGLIRSGSTWSYNVCRELIQLAAAGQKLPFGSSYLHSQQLDLFIVQQWSRSPGPTLVKAHELGPYALANLQSGAVKGVCTFRDPRDCVASDMVFTGLGFDASVYRVNVSLECLRSCEPIKPILMVRYEEMMADRLGNIRRIAAHLGFGVSEEVVNYVDSRTNVESSKKVCEQIRNLTIKQVFEIESHRVDPVTHLHENHIGNAKIGRWRDELSAQQGAYLTEYFAPWLLKWGYETPDSLARHISSDPAVVLQASNPAATASV
jgi:hypothetical protein